MIDSRAVDEALRGTLAAAFLGSLMQADDHPSTDTVFREVPATALPDPYRWAYAACKAVRDQGEPLHPAAIVAAARSMQMEPPPTLVAPTAWLFELWSTAPTGGHLLWFADQIHEQLRRESFAYAGERIAALAWCTDPEVRLAAVEKTFEELLKDLRDNGA